MVSQEHSTPRAFTELKWNRVERGSAPLVQVIVIFVYYLAGMLYVLGRADREHLVDSAVLALQIPVFTGIITGAVLLLVLGLFLRRRRPNALWFEFVGSLYFCLTLAWAGYLAGTLSFGTGAVLMGATLTGYVALERRVVLTSFSVAFLILLGCSIASVQGLLPYAPALREPQDAAGEMFWTNATFFLAGPHLVLSLVATAFMLVQWRRREAWIESLGLTDALTRVHNRRSILGLLEREVARARRLGAPLSVVILDLDHFKRINDTWGHGTGDRVLQEAARLLATTLRQSDEVGRLGGEEFMLLLPDTPEEGALQLTERCRQLLAALAVTADDGTPVPVSASFGLACNAQRPDMSVDALVQAADASLYRAKEAGRNRIELARLPERATAAATPAPAVAQPVPTRPVPGRLHRLRRFLRQMLRGGEHWGAMDRVVLGLTLVAAMYAGFVLWAVYTLQRADRAQLVHVERAGYFLGLLAAALAGTLLLLAVALRLRRRGSQSRLFQHLAQQYYGLTLVSFGYLVGLLSFPSGVMLAGSPLIGFIFFDIAIVCWSTATALLLLTGLAYATALGVLPYAPLMAQPQHHVLSGFWLASYYQFVLPIMAVAIVLADQTLGRWRQRGEQLYRLSMTDMLTGVHNRGSVLRQLRRELARSQRLGSALTVVLLDLDHFKRINDSWGHPTGDRVLQAAAAALAETVRSGDVVGRYGGEEFLLVLPETDDEGAALLVERCRQRLAGLAVASDSGEAVPVSASFGFACNAQQLQASGEVLIRAADEALYRAKAGGRNRAEAALPALAG
jgi:diguanylate cyclase (GGDEF)-like protein